MIEIIKQATTKKDIEEILSPPKVRHDGNKVVAVGKYHIPEEELLIWSLTSLHAPLNSAGFKRYTELFRELLPTEAERALGDG